MTPEEQKKLEQIGAVMDILTVAYPQYYKNVSEDEKYAASLLWANMFADDNIEVVVAAVKTFIATDEKGFPPVIGQIKGHIAKIIGGAEKSELEAWGEVKKALRNSGYNAAEEFEKLDPVIKRIVGSPSQLREWATAETDVLDSVIASNFQRSYRASAKQYREYLTLPNHVKEFIKATSEGMALEKAMTEPETKALPASEARTAKNVHQVASDKDQENVEISVENAKELMENALFESMAAEGFTAQEIAIMKALAFRKRDLPKLLTPEEFDARKAEILKTIGITLQPPECSEEQTKGELPKA